jgi:hypothetical protein
MITAANVSNSSNKLNEPGNSLNQSALELNIVEQAALLSEYGSNLDSIQIQPALHDILEARS